MGKNNMLSLVFKSIYEDVKHDYFCRSFKECSGKDVFSFPDFENINDFKLEENLRRYLNLVYTFKMDYSSYFKEVRRNFECIIQNANYSDFSNIAEFVYNYTDSIVRKFDDNPLSFELINCIRKIYSNDLCNSIVKNIGNSFLVERISKVGEDCLPSCCIFDIYALESVLKKYIFNIKILNKSYGNFFYYMNENDAIRYLLTCVMRNATCNDLLNIEQYINKCNSFLLDDTFNELKEPKYLGSFMGDDLYVKVRISSITYETPYFLSFGLKYDNSFVELPNLRLGISEKDGKKEAYILATQSSQDNSLFDKWDKLCTCYNSILSRYKEFREYNPLHAVSIILSLGLLKGLKIENINVVDYMPFRYQRLVLDNNKDCEEIDALQHRLTNKQLNTYMRVFEHLDNVYISSYPELQGNLSFILGDNISSNNKYVMELFNMAYMVGDQIFQKGGNLVK